MTWGLPVWLDLWLVGLASSMCIIALVARWLGGRKYDFLVRIATISGLPLVLVGIVLIMADLGSPAKFWHFYTQFKTGSPMSVGVWVLPAWLIFDSAAVVSMLQERGERVRAFLMWVLLAVSVILLLYGSVLPAVTGRLLWAGTVLLPAGLVLSALATGGAGLLIGFAAIGKAASRGWGTAVTRVIRRLSEGSSPEEPAGLMARLARVNAVLLASGLVVLLGHFVWLGTGGVADAGAVQILAWGQLSVIFWATVLVGIIFPLGTYLWTLTKVHKTGERRLVVFASICVILGGGLLKAVLLAGGQL